MVLKEKNPTSPGVRHQIADNYDDLSGDRPYKPLLKKLSKTGGRDSKGRVSMRHIGGGNLVKYRQIDFIRDKDNIPSRVMTIEYDPNRNARIALLSYADGEKRYILAALGMAVGDTIMSGKDADIRPGNSMQLQYIPVGTVVHNVELTLGRGAQMARSAGAAVEIAAKEGDYAILKLPSGEQRRVHIMCRASIGQIGNIDAKNVVLGKAGKKRHLGRRPEVRGVVMNPCDHPHGGGEGKAGIGREQPVSKWGKPALGKLTRKIRKRSDRFILIRRK